MKACFFFLMGERWQGEFYVLFCHCQVPVLTFKYQFATVSDTLDANTKLGHLKVCLCNWAGNANSFLGPECVYMRKSKMIGRQYYHGCPSVSVFAELSNILCRYCDTGTKLLDNIIWIVLGSVEMAGELAKIHILHHVNISSVKPSIWIMLSPIP